MVFYTDIGFRLAYTKWFVYICFEVVFLSKI